MIRDPEPHASQASVAPGAVERRDFLRLMGASLAAAGAGACTRQPDEAIVPYGRSPEDLVPGVPLHFATAMPWATGALGILVESHMGRPTKIEGNPLHPASLGATDAFAQAEVLGLYDPDRSQVVLRAGRISTFGEFLSGIAPALDAQAAEGGAGLRVLTPTVTSPTLGARLAALAGRFPRARWHQWEPVHRDRERAGALAAFGRDLVPRHRFDRARVVLSLGADFLAGPEGVAASRGLVEARRRGRDSAEPARLWAVEAGPSLVGAKADERLPLAPSGVVAFAGALATELGLAVRHAELSAEARVFAAAAARELESARGAGLVVAGPELPPEVHALAHALNRRLGNAGQTVSYLEPPCERSEDQGASLRALVGDLEAGAVELLVILGGNPAYDAPLDFEAALGRAGLSVHLGLHEDETSALSHWHVPEAHFLESWGDVRAADGTVSIVQPLIAPLYGGKTPLELVSVLVGEAGAKPYDLVRDHWRARLDGDFERAWRRALHDGVVAGTERPAQSASAGDAPRDLTAGARPAGATLETAAGSIELRLVPDLAVHDGRFANNGWLQECPRPLTKLTWDNAVLLGPATAAGLGLETGDRVRLPAGPSPTRAEVEGGAGTGDGASLEAPVLVTLAQPEGAATVALGYGRARAGGVGSGVGFDAYSVQRALGAGRGGRLEREGGRHAFAITQDHHSMEDRDLIRVERPGGHGDRDHGHHGKHVSIYPGHGASEAFGNRAWGMVIDLDACTGCNACVVACQSENNIPVVGKDEVAKGRELHWIRIDRYFEAGPLGPSTRFQPVPCMHCENAPCEVVCPVAATTHSPEGLNEMTYNRCVGTRYCANNCPYKVRRFNFFRYADWNTESLKLGRNPDVTVRSRGVMEKCTFCVQRINQARIAADREGRPIADGEVITACQGVCPARAITFGDINDASSAVAAKRHEPGHYGLLEELNTRPRTTYLPRFENPHPELGGAPERDDRGSGHGEGHG